MSPNLHPAVSPEAPLSEASGSASMRRELAEKEAALQRANDVVREIDHRSMNSLMAVASLLLLQSDAAKTAGASAQLKVAARRVTTIAHIHRYFHREGTLDGTSGLKYLRHLCTQMPGLFEPATIKVEGTDAWVPAAHLVPIGLISIELVTNAIRHGGGAVSVAFGPAAEGEYALAVTDEGKGLPQDFEPGRDEGLGLKVVIALVQQLSGRLTVGRGAGDRGARVAVVFKGPSPLRP